MDRVSVKLHGPIDWLKSQPSDLAYPSAKRHGPHVASGRVVPGCIVTGTIGIPVGRHDRPAGQVIALLQVVVDEVLQQHLVYSRPIRGTCNGEQIIDEDTNRPMPWLHQCYHRRTKAELTLTRLRTRSGRQDEGRS